MKSKAILRIDKLKSATAVRRSLLHAFREQETPNADPARTHANTHIGAANSAEALAKFNALMPEKVRKNAVLAVEYLITGSPEALDAMTPAQQDAYFADALEWLKAKHGAENVVYAGIHRDETTPHLSAFVVPLDERGKLNCRSFFGESNALGKMQTDFARQVGAKYRLERGLERSRARHTTIRQFYGLAGAPAPKMPSLSIPEAGFLEGKEAYGERVRDELLEQLRPCWESINAKANLYDQLADREHALEIREKDVAERETLARQLHETSEMLAKSFKRRDEIVADLTKQLERAKANVELYREGRDQALDRAREAEIQLESWHGHEGKP